MFLYLWVLVKGEGRWKSQCKTIVIFRIFVFSKFLLFYDPIKMPKQDVYPVM